MNRCALFLPLLCCAGTLLANNPLKKDTLYTELKNDIVILSSTKETNSLRSLPAAVSVFSQKNLEALQVDNLKGLSAFVPNYFVSDYGSKMTAPVYIRGIGARSGSQTVSMYIDNIPYFNTTSFDSELYDIQRVEVLRGTQGTLYGRNAMGGILNVYTYSPLSYEGTSVSIGGGNYGSFSGNVSRFQKINNKLGISVSAYYKEDDGYFTNQYSGNKVDDSKTAGTRLKLSWQVSPSLTAGYSVSYDYVDQGAFPYANTETNQINYNSEGYYKRNLVTNGLSLHYRGKGYEVNSTTGYQYLSDHMNMDQDYTPLSMFRINQRQIENSISQEITIKSDNKSDYQWSNGLYGFYDYLHTTSPVYMMRDGIQSYLQDPLDAAHASNPFVPEIKFTDDQIDLNSRFKRPVYGAAVFHQSTFNNILDTEGLSFTFGIRLDYEKTKLEYDANTMANYTMKPFMSPVQTLLADTTMQGKTSTDYFELLPKAVIKYQTGNNSYIYASASRGYKTGGHNIQIFADLLQEALEAAMGRSKSIEESLDERITYKPEYSWNYEIGGQHEIIGNSLSASYALYYIDIRDMQITDFIRTGGGRKVSNAGKAVSKGFELGMKARPCSGFYLYANYGFADAKFKDYVLRDKDGKVIANYIGNRTPFAPRSTFSIGGNVSYNTKRCPVIDRVNLDANFTRIGRVYWNEANDISEPSYNTVDARLSFDKSVFSLELWAKNIFDKEYRSFLFESNGSHFAQMGKPARWGASLKIKL